MVVRGAGFVGCPAREHVLQQAEVDLPVAVSVDDLAAKDGEKVGLERGLFAKAGQRAKKTDECVLNEVFRVGSASSLGASEGEESPLESIDELRPAFGAAATKLFEQIAVSFVEFAHSRVVYRTNVMMYHPPTTANTTVASRTDQT